jgi:hypothetical protein
MQRKLKSLLAIASLVGSAAIFFIACGDGEMIQLNDQNINDLLDIADNNFKTDLDSIIKDGPTEPSSSSSEPEPSSSSRASEPSSSSNGEATPSSSSRASTQSSSSAPVTQSSSSRAAASSSSKASSGGENVCQKENKKSGFTCDWNKTTNIAPGVNLKPTKSGDSGCEIEWFHVIGDQNPVNDWDLALGCEPLPEDGVITEGSKTYALFAKLTCSGTSTPYVNKCAHEVSAGAAPYLKGTCSWSKNPTTTARGAVPSGIEVVDDDKICGTTKPPVVWKYDGDSKTWPKEGGPLPEAKTYSDVRATAACSNYDIEPSANCPALPVKAGADYQITCKGDQISATTCNKIEQAVQNDECIDFEINWTNANYHPNIKITCEGQFSGNNPSSTLSLKVGSKPAVSKTGDYYVSVEAGLITSTPVGETEVLGICISYTTTGTAPPGGAKCKIGNN